MAEKKNSDDETKDLTKKEEYLPAIPDKSILEQLRKDNLEGAIPDFELIKIPTGGQLAWGVPTETGEDNYQKEVIGVVLDHYPTRVYWPGEYEGGNKLPDCSSLDGKTGIGNPGGPCHSCQFSQFDQETGKVPCKEVRRVYVLTSESILPFLIPLPPTSGAARRSPWTSYVTKLFGRSRSINKVVTKFTLLKDKNRDGIEYSRVLPFMVRELNQSEIDKAVLVTELFSAAMRQRPLTPEDEDNTEENGGSKGLGGKEPWDR